MPFSVTPSFHPFFAPPAASISSQNSP
jgi:hypothetical protein